MKEIILNSKQRMLSPDQLAYELGQIPTPEKMETNKFLKKCVIINNHDTYIIKNHIVKNNNTNDDEEYETKSPLDF